MTDFELVDRWRGGDKTAGQELFERHFASISRFFTTKCEAEADELVQATFLSCLRARDSFRKQSSFRTYLFAIARNELYRVLREKKKDQVLDFEQSSMAQLSATTPGARIDRNKEKQRLIEAMRQLPVAQQTLLELHYWENMSIAELADVFDAEQPAIRQRLHRARVALREKMEGQAPPGVLESLETMDTWAQSLNK